MSRVNPSCTMLKCLFLSSSQRARRESTQGEARRLSLESGHSAPLCEKVSHVCPSGCAGRARLPLSRVTLDMAARGRHMPGAAVSPRRGRPLVFSHSDSPVSCVVRGVGGTVSVALLVAPWVRGCGARLDPVVCNFMRESGRRGRAPTLLFRLLERVLHAAVKRQTEDREPAVSDLQLIRGRSLPWGRTFSCFRRTSPRRQAFLQICFRLLPLLTHTFWRRLPQRGVTTPRESCRSFQVRFG